MRIVLTYLLPLILPTALYLTWLTLRAKRAEAQGGTAPPPKVPWVWLAAAGLALAMLVAAGTALMGEGRPGDVYRAPYVDDSGKVVPGRFE